MGFLSGWPFPAITLAMKFATEPIENRRQRDLVAQISNLLYRRAALCHARDLLKPSRTSKTQSTATRRYARLKIFATSAFTLAEVLASLVFMAILIPVALEGLHIASRAGEVAARKSEAALVAER